MASSKVMASSSSANSDLGRQSSSIHSLSLGDHNKSFGSMSMDDLLRNIYTDHPAADMLPRVMDGGESNGCAAAAKTVDEVWKEITAGEGKIEGGQVEGLVFKDPPYEEMTLEDFLAKAGAVGEEDVRVSSVGGGFQSDPMLSNSNPFQQQQQVESAVRVFGDGSEGGGGGGGGGRGKRRAVQEPMDRVAQQRQRRMIKNRESAARSRERKQAYTSELESLVTQLQEDQAKLVREQVVICFGIAGRLIGTL
ncbi:ABSCISIC ACID-INSENSITIVE 5-like protein 4 isoform X3 [Cinnamomum micranthum f. kanehirae]|uniref:ABSCISIC ACID-INSENSITIVE 5-like protein 4 isoform X3 n=1 Tax=Cinnamomum micranthum f. kanehirae TaxID=337451 RepID=A0A3S3MNH4_9MAGN|nr:ABSCISIC ACID-INSENSITIVE 5-like protein 4 isoform X3 [Cinnamomum micranthum f. kanehirae]